MTPAELLRARTAAGFNYVQVATVYRAVLIELLAHNLAVVNVTKPKDGERDPADDAAFALDAVSIEPAQIRTAAVARAAELTKQINPT